MSSLKSYVERYLLNPAASFNVDDEGNQETKAQIVDSLLDEEKASTQHQSISKLRARRAAVEAEKDPRYRGKKVLRKDLKKESTTADYDAELAKMCIVEGSDDEEQDDDSDDEDIEDAELEGDDDEGEDDDEEEDGSEEESDGNNESTDKILSQKLKKLGAKKSSSAKGIFTDEDEDSAEENEVVKRLYQGLQKEKKGVTFIDDGDFSKFADDTYDDEEDDDDAEEEEEEENEREDDKTGNRHIESALKKFQQEDMAGEVKKGQAVKNQLGIYDSLFEARICLQKVLSASNQLPQHNTYKLFLREKDPNYIKNLSSAKVATKNLLNSLLQIQELLLRQNPETSHIVTGKTPKDTGTESDEEITSSEDEDEKPEEDNVAEGFRGLKRKMAVEEYEEVLSKRHAALLPFRDQTINKWYEKTKLLSSRSARNNRFSGFETSALQQLQNILSNREQLIRRTQLTGTTRGTTYHVLGRHRTDDDKVESEEYDPEIFDDTDFYTRALEEVLKAKVALSDDMTDVSRKWIEIQNLRRKAKKKVDKKASKGRKIRYEVMSKLQQYMAPSHGPQMDDAAINTLFGSLFGKAVQRQKGAKAE